MKLLPGDPAPLFIGRSQNGERIGLDAVTGNYVFLTFVASAAEPITRQVLAKFAEMAQIDGYRASLFIITADPHDEINLTIPLRPPAIRILYDYNRELKRLYGVVLDSQTPVTFLISPRMQILGVFASPGSAQHPDLALKTLMHFEIPSTPPSYNAHPPILMVRSVFESEICRDLIKGHQNQGGRDWLIEGEAITGILKERMGRRVIPEIHKAFQFETSYIERYLVGRYGVGEEDFRYQRDNTPKNTAHRRFTVILNLNAEEYDGGDVCFPEYGPKTYRAPTGGCIVFSGSLLHETCRVTKGVRYVFLPFLYDEAIMQIKP